MTAMIFNAHSRNLDYEKTIEKARPLLDPNQVNTEEYFHYARYREWKEPQSLNFFDSFRIKVSNKVLADALKYRFDLWGFGRGTMNSDTIRALEDAWKYPNYPLSSTANGDSTNANSNILDSFVYYLAGILGKSVPETTTDLRTKSPTILVQQRVRSFKKSKLYRENQSKKKFLDEFKSIYNLGGAEFMSRLYDLVNGDEGLFVMALVIVISSALHGSLDIPGYNNLKEKSPYEYETPISDMEMPLSNFSGIGNYITDEEREVILARIRREETENITEKFKAEEIRQSEKREKLVETKIDEVLYGLLEVLNSWKPVQSTTLSPSPSVEIKEWCSQILALNNSLSEKNKELIEKNSSLNEDVKRLHNELARLQKELREKEAERTSRENEAKIYAQLQDGSKQSISEDAVQSDVIENKVEPVWTINEDESEKVLNLTSSIPSLKESINEIPTITAVKEETLETENDVHSEEDLLDYRNADPGVANVSSSFEVHTKEESTLTGNVFEDDEDYSKEISRTTMDDPSLHLEEQQKPHESSSVLDSPHTSVPSSSHTPLKSHSPGTLISSIPNSSRTSLLHEISRNSTPVHNQSSSSFTWNRPANNNTTNATISTNANIGSLNNSSTVSTPVLQFETPHVSSASHHIFNNASASSSQSSLSTAFNPLGTNVPVSNHNLPNTSIDPHHNLSNGMLNRVSSGNVFDPSSANGSTFFGNNNNGPINSFRSSQNRSYDQGSGTVMHLSFNDSTIFDNNRMNSTLGSDFFGQVDSLTSPINISNSIRQEQTSTFKTTGAANVGASIWNNASTMQAARGGNSFSSFGLEKSNDSEDLHLTNRTEDLRKEERVKENNPSSTSKGVTIRPLRITKSGKFVLHDENDHVTHSNSKNHEDEAKARFNYDFSSHPSSKAWNTSNDSSVNFIVANGNNIIAQIPIANPSLDASEFPALAKKTPESSSRSGTSALKPKLAKKPKDPLAQNTRKSRTPDSDMSSIDSSASAIRSSRATFKETSNTSQVAENTNFVDMEPKFLPQWIPADQFEPSEQTAELSDSLNISLSSIETQEYTLPSIYTDTLAAAHAKSEAQLKKYTGEVKSKDKNTKTVKQHTSISKKSKLKGVSISKDREVYELPVKAEAKLPVIEAIPFVPITKDSPKNPSGGANAGKAESLANKSQAASKTESVASKIDSLTTKAKFTTGRGESNSARSKSSGSHGPTANAEVATTTASTAEEEALNVESSNKDESPTKQKTSKHGGAAISKVSLDRAIPKSDEGFSVLQASSSSKSPAEDHSNDNSDTASSSLSANANGNTKPESLLEGRVRTGKDQKEADPNQMEEALSIRMIEKEISITQNNLITTRSRSDSGHSHSSSPPPISHGPSDAFMELAASLESDFAKYNEVEQSVAKYDLTEGISILKSMQRHKRYGEIHNLVISIRDLDPEYAAKLQAEKEAKRKMESRSIREPSSEQNGEIDEKKNEQADMNTESSTISESASKVANKTTTSDPVAESSNGISSTEGSNKDNLSDGKNGDDGEDDEDKRPSPINSSPSPLLIPECSICRERHDQSECPKLSREEEGLKFPTHEKLDDTLEEDVSNSTSEKKCNEDELENKKEGDSDEHSDKHFQFPTVNQDFASIDLYLDESDYSNFVYDELDEDADFLELFDTISDLFPTYPRTYLKTLLKLSESLDELIESLFLEAETNELREEAKRETMADTASKSTTNEYSSSVYQLKDIFPTFDLEILNRELESHNGDVELTTNSLLSGDVSDKFEPVVTSSQSVNDSVWNSLKGTADRIKELVDVPIGNITSHLHANQGKFVETLIDIVQNYKPSEPEESMPALDFLIPSGGRVQRGGATVGGRLHTSRPKQRFSKFGPDSSSGQELKMLYQSNPALHEIEEPFIYKALELVNGDVMRAIEICRVVIEHNLGNLTTKSKQLNKPKQAKKPLLSLAESISGKPSSYNFDGVENSLSNKYLNFKSRMSKSNQAQTELLNECLKRYESTGVLDLHGFRLAGAMEVTKQALRIWWEHELEVRAIEGRMDKYGSKASEIEPLSIITGRGLHSTNGISVIRKGVKTHLDANGYLFHEEVGGFVVYGKKKR